MNQVKAITLLDDDPVAESYYQWHTKVAESIYEFIRTEQKGRSICLTGARGSGKSTIIDILSRICEKEENQQKCRSHIFVFDAWLHVNDPIRRSFVEELEGFYGPEGLKLIGDRNKDLRRLVDIATGKRVEHTSQETPSISSLDIFVISIVLASLALGNAYARKVFETNGPHLSEILYTLVFFLGSAIVTAILSKNGLFLQKASTETKVVKLGSSEATSIEFQHAVNAILAAAQAKKADCHKLVIVVDNLDRIPSTEASRILATLRGFFSAEKHPHVWLIVPLDDTLKSEAKSKQLSGVFAFTDTGGAGEAESTKSFIEKAFDVSFYVAEPVVTGAAGFFRSQMDKVFSENLDAEVKNAVFELYDIDGRAHTPRKVKRFINDFAALLKIWNDELKKFPLTVALYCLKRSDIQNDLRRYLFTETSRSRVTPRQEFIINDPDWQQHFAAIFYGVPVKDAAHVLLDSPIEVALQNGDDSEKFTMMSETSGFHYVLKNKLSTGLLAGSLSADVCSLLNVVLCVTALENLKYAKVNDCWNIIVKSLRRIERWQGVGDRSPHALKSLLERIPENEFIQATDRIIHSLLNVVGEGSTRGDLWVALISIVKSALDGRSMNKSFNSSILRSAKEAKATTYFPALLYAASENKYELADVFSGILDQNTSLQNGCAELVGDSRSLDSLRKIFDFLDGAGTKFEFNNVAKDLVQVVNKCSGTADIYSACTILLKIGARHPSEGITKILQSALEGGGIYWYVNHTNKAHNYEFYMCIAFCMIVSSGVSLSTPNQTQAQAGLRIFQSTMANSTGNREELQNILLELSKVTSPDDLFNIAFNGPQPFYFALLSEKLNGDQEFISTSKHFVDRFGKYQRVFSNDIKLRNAFFERVMRQPDFALEITSRPFMKIPMELYKVIFANPDNVSVSICDHLEDGLKSISVEDWTTHITALVKNGTISQPIELYMFLSKVRPLKQVVEVFATPLIEKISLIGNTGFTKEFRDFLKSFLQSLEGTKRVEFNNVYLDNLINLTKSNNPQKLDNFLQLFGGYNGDSQFTQDQADYLNQLVLKNTLVNTPQFNAWLKRFAEKE